MWKNNILRVELHFAHTYFFAKEDNNMLWIYIYKLSFNLLLHRFMIVYFINNYCIPRTKYVRGILWFSRRYAAASAASAFHHLRDNLKKPYRIASMFDM